MKSFTIFGRPMKMVERCIFVDKVTGDQVGLYLDTSNGRFYLATGPWALFRMKWKSP